MKLPELFELRRFLVAQCRWDKPSDCFDKNETEPREGKAITSAPKQARQGVLCFNPAAAPYFLDLHLEDATFEHFRVLSECAPQSLENLRSPIYRSEDG